MKQYEYLSVHIGKLFGAASEEHREITTIMPQRVGVMWALFPPI